MLFSSVSPRYLAPPTSPCDRDEKPASYTPSQKGRESLLVPTGPFVVSRSVFWCFAAPSAPRAAPVPRGTLVCHATLGLWDALGLWGAALMGGLAISMEETHTYFIRTG